MLGISFALLAALSTSLQATFFKTTPHIDSWTINWARFVVVVPILAVFVSIFNEWVIPPLPFFLVVIFGVLPLELVITTCMVRAYQLSPQSLVGPLMSFSTVFSIPVAFFLLGEVPSSEGLLGIFLIVVGALSLGWAGTFTFRSAFQKLTKEKGTRLMIIVALAASLSIPLAKYLFQYAPPLVVAFYGTVAVLTAMTVRVIWMRSMLRLSRRDWLMIGSTSIFTGLTYVFHYLALSFIFASYFIALKRLSIVFDVLLGRTVYKEENFFQRLLGASIMLGGLLLITIGIL